MNKDRSDKSGKTPANNLIGKNLPQVPQEFMDLRTTLACHPTLFEDQAELLYARYAALLKKGFSEDQALQLILQFGLKPNLTNE